MNTEEQINAAVKKTLNSPKIEINHLLQVVTVNGVDFPFQLLQQMTMPDPEKLLRIHREANVLLVKAYDLRLLRAIVDDFPKIEEKKVQLATVQPKVQL